MELLKPCPFCGCNDMKIKTHRYNSLTIWHIVSCVKCKAKFHDITRKTAIEGWNKRYQSQSEANL